MTYSTDNPSKLALVAGTGMFLSTLDSGIINIAIPTLLKNFAAPMSTIIWAVTAYTLILSATVLLFGKLADRWGRLRIYVIGLLLFAVSSLLCGLANNISYLIAFRALQGLSAAMMQATSIALITTRLQGEAAHKAMGIFAILLGLGPTLAPVIGGFLLSALDWRWLFWLNIPICLLGLYGCKQLAPATENLHRQNIHYVNLLLIGCTVFAALIAMNSISSNSHYAYIAAGISVGLLIIYLISENNTSYPVIQLHLFKRLTFVAPMLGVIAFGGATAVAFMLPPLYFTQLHALPAWQVGLISLSAPLGLVLSAKLLVKFLLSISSLAAMLTGMFLMTLSLLVLTQVQLYWPTYAIFLLLLCYGIGGGLFQTPCYMNVTAQFPSQQQASITALVRMIQNLGISIFAAGAAMFISIKSIHSSDLLHGIQHGWWLATAICGLAWAALLLTRRPSQITPT